MMTAPDSVDSYIASFPESIREAIEQVRTAILEAVPDAEESISYAMPTFKKGGLLAHFAGYAKHVGLYPGPVAISMFADDIAKYKHAKGSVQFPLSEPMPVDLVKKIVTFRLKHMAHGGK